MLTTLPAAINDFMTLSWEQIAVFYQELNDRALDAASLESWLADWTHLDDRISETFTRLYLAMARDTMDEAAEKRFNEYLESVYPAAQTADQALKNKLLASGLEPPGFDIPLRNIQGEVELYKEENLPLLVEERKLSAEFDKISGAQTVIWEGDELTVEQLKPIYQDVDRAARERAWRMEMDRRLEDRETLNKLWGRFLNLRGQLAANAGLPDYRAYRWQEMQRFDYTPEDSLKFHEAIEHVVVPAAARVYARHRDLLGLQTLRPWDVDVDPLGRPPLQPYKKASELESKAASIFRQLDPQLAGYFDTMRRESLLDLDNRKGKAPGGFCTDLAVEKRPYIFMNAVGVQNDVRTILHEAGHAFHVFETEHLPYHQQVQVGMEMAEVASMAMELLTSPYLAVEGSFYNEAQAARARIEQLEEVLLFWPYMAVVDAFQHWAYTHPEAALMPANCDEAWSGLWDRFMVGIDFSGYEAEKATGWHRKLHIFQYPLYYIEYGLARLGAVQIWRNSLLDPQGALMSYRQALRLGGTASLPELYEAAGAKLAFDEFTLGEAVALIEETIAELEN
jgi:oligoendopeptidase F